MFNRYWLLLLCLFLFSAALRAQTDSLQASYKQANQLYQQEQYDSAIIIYESILAKDYESAQVYYNLGNAYFRQEQMAKAILNYERAKRLDPGNEDINYNLAYSNSLIKKQIENNDNLIKQWYKRQTNKLNVNQWAITSLLNFALTLLLFAGFLFLGQARYRKLSFWGSIVMLFITIMCFSLAQQKSYDQKAHKQAIVMPKTVWVKSSPDTNAKDRLRLPEGTKVTITESGEFEGWVKIRLSDGSQGWLAEKSLERI